jgi:hypothetical protein
MKKRYSAMTLCFVLAMAMITLTMPQSAFAHHGDDEKPIRLRANAEMSLLGEVYSTGSVALNGRSAIGSQTLWGSELIQVLSEHGASVSIDSFGLVNLKKGAIVRLAKNTNANSDETNRGVLIASLVSGEMTVKLRQGVSAYVQSCGSVFTSSNGAVFRVSAKEGQALAVASLGTLETLQQTAQKKYFVRPVGLGATTSVRARSTRQIQVQVTDENDKPVPDIPIIFALGTAGAGSLGSGTAAAAASTATVQTNAQGLASIQFTAGPNAASTEITATVENTRYSWTGTLSVAKAVGFWTPLNTTLVVVGAAAAVGTGVYIGTRNNDREPIRQSGNPDIRP